MSVTSHPEWLKTFWEKRTHYPETVCLVRHMQMIQVKCTQNIRGSTWYVKWKDAGCHKLSSAALFRVQRQSNINPVFQKPGFVEAGQKYCASFITSQKL